MSKFCAVLALSSPRHLHSQTVHQAVLAAKTMGLQALFGPCATLRCQASGRDHLQYVAVPMTLSLPLLVEVETTALQDAHLLLGIESHSGLELLVNGAEEEGASCLRWVRSAPGSMAAQAWTMRREIMCVPYGSPGFAGPGESSWTRFSVFLGVDGRIVVRFQDAEWGNVLPKEPLEILKRASVTLSIGILVPLGPEVDVPTGPILGRWTPSSSVFTYRGVGSKREERWVGHTCQSHPECVSVAWIPRLARRGT
ncbi:unnamed protein product [Durusdinium trenchii]|uniref:Uncharacterized protein n=1 Tax=Durusdinium trenchii TaxID=1381693 RepID=A0ABP0LSM7_9DINO